MLFLCVLCLTSMPEGIVQDVPNAGGALGVVIDGSAIIAEPSLPNVSDQ